MSAPSLLTTSQASSELDLAFVIDATGSMADELEYLKTEIDFIANTVQEKHKDLSIRYALIVYRDHGDEYLTRVINFTNDLAAFKKDLAEQHALGGGDYPEAMDSAIASALQLSYRPAARRLLFLMNYIPLNRASDALIDGVSYFTEAANATSPYLASS